MLGAIRGVLLGEREDKKRGPGPHLFGGKGRGNRGRTLFLRWGGERSSYLSEKRCREAGATGYLIGHQDKSFPVKKRKQAAGRPGGWSVVVARASLVVGQSAREGQGSGTRRTMTHLQAGLSPETLEKARLELNENPDTLHQDIQEVRDMVITRPDIGFLRTDDAFILRFLRARKFHHFEAFRLLAQYFEYRQQNLDMFKSFKATDPGIKQALKDGFPGGLANLDHYGRKILVLFAANWDQSR